MVLGSERGTVPGNRDTYLKLLVALCCVVAVGLAATAYEDTIDTDPDEIIDVHHSWIPLGKETIMYLKDPQGADLSSGEAVQNGGAANDDTSAGGGGGTNDGGSADSDADAEASSNDDSSADAEDAASDAETDEESGECTGGLVGVLSTLFPSLIPPCGPFYLLGLFLPAVALLAAVGAGYRYRRRLLAAFLAVGGWLRDCGGSQSGDGTPTWPSEQPDNEVYRAWHDMVERADLENPWSRSPRQCASAAVDAGLDSAAVHQLTTLFEEVRYGGADLTDDLVESARDCRQQLEDGQQRELAGAGGELGEGSD